MNFLAMSPAMWLTLFGGFGGVITLLYLLRLRRRRLEVPFGPLWQKVLAEKQSTSFFRSLKNILSLLLQLAVLALVLTAIADPRWTGDMAVADATTSESDERVVLPHHTFLIVDASASMQIGTRMADAKTAARQIIDSLAPGDSVVVARVDHDVAVLTDWSSDRDALHAALETITPRDAATRFTSAVELAASALSGLAHAETVLITDREAQPVTEALAGAARLRVIPVGTEVAGNTTVSAFAVRSHLGYRLEYAVQYTLRNKGPGREVTVHLYTDRSGKAQSRADFQKSPPQLTFKHTLPADAEQTFEHAGLALDGNRAALVVDATGDLFPVDDTAFAVVPTRKQVKVQLVGPENLFLMAALSTRKNVDVKRIDLADFQTTEGSDLTVFTGAAPAELQRGNLAFVNVRTGALPYDLADAVTDPAPLLVPPTAAAHPAMAHVKFVDLEARDFRPLVRKKGQEVLARTKKGQTAILAAATAERRFVAVGFDPIESEWVGHYSFSIFFVNAVNWFFREEAAFLRSQGLDAAWRVSLPWAAGQSVDVVKPDGKVVRALVDGAGGLAYTGDAIGIYAVKAPPGTPKALSADILVPAALYSATESALTPALLDFVPYVPRVETDAAVPDLRLAGLALWQLLALAAAGLLLVEWFTFHRRWTV
ncbi:MAG: VWA domain-containing protein [Myxococcales bacterium]|nr:VWA domain-containing protein [Myxococcales bacterium]